jgi:hypothetical protein
VSELRKQLNARARRRRETLPKLYNYPKREREKPYKYPQQATSVKNALGLLALVFKFKKSLQLLHQSSHHVAATSTFQKNIDSTS